MQYYRKDDLEELRKSNRNYSEDISLYAVYVNLGNPPIKIKHISKKYVYWEDDTKHSYPSKSAGYSIFDNKIEAWKHYKYLYEKRTKYIREKYEADMKQLTRATQILQECSEKTPEYFI
jgi:hypothetical protein